MNLIKTNLFKHIAKSILMLACILLLSTCSGSSSGGNGNGGNGGNGSNETRTVSGVDGVITINSKNTIDLFVSGVGNTIYVESNIGMLDISGVENYFYFSSGVEVEDCDLSGVDNIAEKEADVSLSCTDSGIGNIGF